MHIPPSLNGGLAMGAAAGAAARGDRAACCCAHELHGQLAGVQAAGEQRTVRGRGGSDVLPLCCGCCS